MEKRLRAEEEHSITLSFHSHDDMEKALQLLKQHYIAYEVESISDYKYYKWEEVNHEKINSTTLSGALIDE